MFLKIGSRASPLALKQTEIFISKLKLLYDFDFEIIKIKTSGDVILDKPLYDIGGKALFVKELERALESGEIDFAVHSLKDVPGVLEDKFEVSGYIGREYPFDVLISKIAKNILDLPSNAVVGTSSPRRIAFLKKLRPDIKIANLRGNINSRIEKLLAGEYDAIILAEAGLRRLGLYNEFCTPITEDLMIPAVGQGVIAAEFLKSRIEIKKLIESVSDREICDIVELEREFLACVNADCDTPTAAYITPDFSSFMLATGDMKHIEELRTLDEISGKDAAKILLDKIAAKS